MQCKLFTDHNTTFTATRSNSESNLSLIVEDINILDAELTNITGINLFVLKYMIYDMQILIKKTVKTMEYIVK